MDFNIGAEVIGTEGKLGEVHRVIVDARSNHVTDLVVKHGFVFGKERVVPLSCVTGVKDGVVSVNVDGRAFEAMNGFADDRYHAPDPNYVGPPGFDNTAFMLDRVVAFGGGVGTGQQGGAPPFGFPGGEQTSPDDRQRPVYAEGTSVHDAAGEKVGEIARMTIDPTNGSATHIVLRQGFLFHHEAEIPISWVQDLSDKGVMLNVMRAAVEAQVQHARTT
ncbi:MAG: PRC-barrel domain-containing protein [Dehalococcoidia bacterium]